MSKQDMLACDVRYDTLSSVSGQGENSPYAAKRQGPVTPVLPASCWACSGYFLLPWSLDRVTDADVWREKGKRGKDTLIERRCCPHAGSEQETSVHRQESQDHSASSDPALTWFVTGTLQSSNSLQVSDPEYNVVRVSS